MGKKAKGCEERRLGNARVPRVWRDLVKALSAAAFVWLFAALPVEAQRMVRASVRQASGLLGAEEGRVIVDVALEKLAPLADGWDCSHVVHSIYTNAGHAYPYASSSDIYAGNANFVRVKHPRAGDVVAWPGHLGIVVDPGQHTFYSLVRTGLESQNYESAYWRSRGPARFYRLRVRSSPVATEGKRGVAVARPILSEGR
jgi:NlpC/P60 family